MLDGHILKEEEIQGLVRCTSSGKIEPIENEKEGVLELLNQERLKAYQMGKEEGEKRGYAKAKQEMSAFWQLLQTIIDKTLEEKKRIFENLKPEIIEFAVAIAEEVIRVELTQPETFAKLIASFLTMDKFYSSEDAIKIIISPSDLLMLEEQLSEIRGVKFVSDSSMNRGDCRIETKTALLNFDISRELEDLHSKVLRQ